MGSRGQPLVLADILNFTTAKYSFHPDLVPSAAIMAHANEDGATS